VARNGSKGATKWVGWIYFAAILMLVAGVFQGIVGLTALLNDTVYIISPAFLAFLDLTAWGWVHLLIAVALITGGISLFSGRLWGRILGVVAGASALLTNMVFIATYPLWSIAAIVVNILIIYALVVHGGEAGED
jgi:hypothetical protein